jgi:hypothetical protein
MDAAAVLLSSRTPGNAMVALFVDYLDGLVAAVARCRSRWSSRFQSTRPSRLRSGRSSTYIDGWPRKPASISLHREKSRRKRIRQPGRGRQLFENPLT